MTSTISIIITSIIAVVIYCAFFKKGMDKKNALKKQDVSKEENFVTEENTNDPLNEENAVIEKTTDDAMEKEYMDKKKKADELWEQAVNYYNAKDYANSLETLKTMENLVTFGVNGHEAIASNAFMLGDFKLALSACASAYAIDSKSQNAAMQFANVWTRIEKAANYMIEKNENIYEIPFPKKTLTIQDVIDLLYQLTTIEAAVYAIGLPKIEELRWKLSLQDPDTHTFQPPRL